MNLEVKLLRGILKVEGQWKRLADEVKPLRQSGETPGRALTDEEAFRLFETAESKPAWLVAYLCTVIANDTGMRGVELKNLRLAHIDLDTRTISIHRSKTDAGMRQILLTNDALKAIVRLIERICLAHTYQSITFYRRRRNAGSILSGHRKAGVQHGVNSGSLPVWERFASTTCATPS